MGAATIGKDIIMAEITRKLDSVGLSLVWSKIIENFIAKGQADLNIIEKVSVNGVELEVTDKGVNIAVPTGALASLDKVSEENLSEALAALINGKADKATTLAGYGITDAYTKTEADGLLGGKADKASTLAGYGITDAYTKDETEGAISTAVKSAVAGVYKVKGSIPFASLPTEGMEEGHVYNISDAFTTTDAFVEGAGVSYPAGTNVCYTENGWDAMAGTYDFSDFMLKSDLQDITSDEIDAICVMPTV